MVIHESAIKRDRQSEKHRTRNAVVKSSIRTAAKSVLEAVEGKDPEKAKAALAKAIPAIAKASAKRAIHKKTASRRISRLTKKVNAALKA